MCAQVARNVNGILVFMKKFMANRTRKGSVPLYSALVSAPHFKSGARKIPLVEKDHLREYLNKLDRNKSLGNRSKEYTHEY